MVSAEQYSDKKAKGLVTVVKVGAAYAMVVKKFNGETGEEMPAEVFAVDSAQLESQKATLQAQITQIDIMLADLAAL